MPWPSERRAVRTRFLRATWRGPHSLRGRLVVAVVLVEVLAIGLLLALGARQLQRTLRAQAGAEAA